MWCRVLRVAWSAWTERVILIQKLRNNGHMSAAVAGHSPGPMVMFGQGRWS